MKNFTVWVGALVDVCVHVCICSLFIINNGERPKKTHIFRSLETHGVCYGTYIIRELLVKEKGEEEN